MAAVGRCGAAVGSEDVDAEPAPDGVLGCETADVLAALADGAAVLGWPASGLGVVQAVRSVVVARQARSVDFGLLRCVTCVSPP